jgi:phosphonate transport system permease protein
MVGVCALVLAETPTIAKVFAEMIENRKIGPIESLRASGASPLQVMRYGLAPQVLPVLAGMSLFLFEANLRASAVLGIVGAGGIGSELEDRIRLLLLDQVAYILLLYIVVTIALDLASQAIRRKLVDG